MSPLVSIIVPTYKRHNRVCKTIQSLLEQTYENIEIIIIDDNGSENSIEREKTYKALVPLLDKNKNISYTALEKNSGGAIARNIGISQAKGKYISFLDDDDTYCPNKIKIQTELLSKNDDKDLAFVKCEMKYNYNNISVVTDKSKYFFGEQLKNHVIDSHAIVGTPSFLFKKTVLEKVSGFSDTPIKQEYLLILKILSHGFYGLHHSDALVNITTDYDGVSVGKSGYKAEAIEKIFQHRLTYAKKYSDFEIEEMYVLHYIEMHRWYISLNRTLSFQYLRRILSIKGFSKLKWFKLLIVFIIKVMLKGNYYKIRNLLRVGK